MTVIVTHHACTRWIERIDGRATHAEALAAIQSRSRLITVAASIGCKVVKLNGGGKLILDGLRVVTVIMPHHPLSGHRVSLS